MGKIGNNFQKIGSEKKDETHPREPQAASTEWRTPLQNGALYRHHPVGRRTVPFRILILCGVCKRAARFASKKATPCRAREQQKAQEGKNTDDTAYTAITPDTLK